ncbi:MAG: hypothetical protein AUH72_06315 [Acidobacteria bacterium 13_1_40CM_4_65_8]|nr:MAG: hypothetical protein AUH72_06315 [Acidobacteria bacterium 13_1_40CM_4_65_8]
MTLDFLDDYPKLEAGQRDRFQQVVTRLLAGEVLTPGSPLKPDPDWRFAERFRELVDSYLRIGGWRLDIDLGLRLARAVHETGAQRVRFSKLESLLLCAVRLYYHEQMRLATEEERCDIAVGTLRERLVHAGKPAAQLSPRALAPALRRLARHSLVQVPRGFEARDDELVVVTALVEKVLPPDRIQEIEQKIKAYMTPRGTERSTVSDPEVDAEGADEEESTG